MGLTQTYWTPPRTLAYSLGSKSTPRCGATMGYHLFSGRLAMRHFREGMLVGWSKQLRPTTSSISPCSFRVNGASRWFCREKGSTEYKSIQERAPKHTTKWSLWNPKWLPTTKYKTKIITNHQVRAVYKIDSKILPLPGVVSVQNRLYGTCSILYFVLKPPETLVTHIISYILYYLRSTRASKITWNKLLFHLFQNPLPRHTYTLSDCDQPCNSLRPSFHELCIFSRMTRRSANTSPRYRRRGGPGRTEIERWVTTMTTSVPGENPI